MRGWWEIAGDDVQALHDEPTLGVKHAVAFHQGRTLAVVQIDGWHWIAGLKGDAHHRKSVDELLVDLREGQESGPLEDERWRHLERNGRRLRWAFEASPAPDETRDAWLDREIDGMRRDAIVSIWPHSLDDDARDLIDRTMRIVGEVLPEHLRRTLSGIESEWLKKEVRGAYEAMYVGSDKDRQRWPEGSQDPAVWLRVLSNDHHWPKLRQCFPSLSSPKLFKQLRKVRNDWAHFAYRQQVRGREIQSLEGLFGLLQDIGSTRAASNVKFIREVLGAQQRRQTARSMP